ncbi:rhodanese-like domain-containing protein [Algivirga pacifica]|uniref:Rhodanese domain-containing protein n=1 Tax=Algivirga pacifica TaxID=1162670 RepID=A0ABP9DEG0_9BACT
MDFLSRLFGAAPQVDYSELLAKGAKIIDVRSPMEFQHGHAPKSINIPLQEVASKVNQIKKYNKPIILVCQSGNRAGQAMSILQRSGIEEVYNAGNWGNMA